MKMIRTAVLLLIVASAFSGCQPKTPQMPSNPNHDTKATVTPSKLHFVKESGQSTVTLDFQNAALHVHKEAVTIQAMDRFIHKPVPSDTLLVNAFMEHEGGHIMKAPVEISKTSQVGVASAVIQFTMAGPWRIEVTTMPNEQPAVFTVDVQP